MVFGHGLNMYALRMHSHGLLQEYTPVHFSQQFADPAGL